MTKRGRNFNDFEKSLIIDLVADFKTIIENKRTDGVSTKEKCQAWDEIMEKYNASCQTGPRTSKQLHALYDFLKKKARSDQHNDHVEIYKTGGGVFNRKLDGTGDITFVVEDDADLAAEGSSSGRESSINKNSVCQTTLLSGKSLSLTTDTLPLSPPTPSTSTVTPVTSAVGSGFFKKKMRNNTSILNELNETIKKRNISKGEFGLEIHEKKCKILDLELKLKNEVFDRTIKIMETEQKAKDVDWETKIILKKIKETELQMKLLQYKKMKGVNQSSEDED